MGAVTDVNHFHLSPTPFIFTILRALMRVADIMGQDTDNKTPVLSRHLNILGSLVALVAVIFLVVYFNTENGPDSAYFLGGSFTCFVIAILSFGFSKIIELIVNGD